MRITVTDKCTGHGRCYTVAKEVYEGDEEGYNVARGTTYEVGSDLAGPANVGAINCPESAITVAD